MAKLLPISIDGEIVYVEVEAAYGSEQTSAVDQVLDRAEDAFERAKVTITSVSKSIVGAILALDKAVTPNEFELQFAIKFTAEGNAVLASAAAEATLNVTMTYGDKKGE
jgi:hypothetical protein